MPLDFDFWQYRLFSWGTGLALALLLRGLARWPWHKALGMGCMAVPLWTTTLGIVESFAPLLEGDVVLRARTRAELSDMYARGLLTDVGYAGAGFLLWASDGSWRRLLCQGPRDLASRLAALGFPTGGRSEARSALLGLVLFPFLLLGAYAVQVVASRSGALTSGDESQVWANMTPYHALMLALGAAFGEEVFYRGFLQTLLARRLGAPLAVALQALFFGFAHAGYGNWAHVLQASLFGAAAGLAAWRLGLWAPIVLHALVDLYALAPDTAGNAPWWGWLLGGLLMLNVAATLLWSVHQAGRLRARVGAGRRAA